MRIIMRLLFVIVFIYLISDVKCVYIPCLSAIDRGYGVGVVKQTVNQSLTYCSYLGIPYAKPPVGELRFESPQALFYSETKYFDKVGEICRQINDFGRPTGSIGSEDCLFLNVYTPKHDIVNRTREKDQNELYPVLFWIHGGSFIAGSSETDVFGPDFLIEKEIIVVTINYRLDALGFLSAPSLNISGNFGLKDQVAALKWVQRNIKNFGGDPKKVTIMGWSAGAASVTYHLYSRMAKGLFRKAIVISGVLTEPWAFLYEPEACARKYMDLFGVKTREELKKLDTNQVIAVARRTELDIVYFNLHHSCFMPTIERRKKGFIRDTAYNIVKRAPINDVPIMVGQTAAELEVFYGHIGEYKMSTLNIPNKNELSNKIVGDYFNSHLNSSKQSKDFIVNTVNQADILYGINYFLNELRFFAKSPIYSYRFEFDGKFGYAKYTYESSGTKTSNARYGAFHGDDLGYIFTPYSFNSTFGNEKMFAEEINTLIKMVEMWSNFIKFGNPTPNPEKDEHVKIKWEPYNHPNASLARQYLNIDKGLEMRKDAEQEGEPHFKLWDKVFKCLYFFKCNFSQ